MHRKPRVGHGSSLIGSSRINDGLARVQNGSSVISLQLTTYDSKCLCSSQGFEVTSIVNSGRLKCNVPNELITWATFSCVNAVLFCVSFQLLNMPQMSYVSCPVNCCLIQVVQIFKWVKWAQLAKTVSAFRQYISEVSKHVVKVTLGVNCWHSLYLLLSPLIYAVLVLAELLIA